MNVYDSNRIYDIVKKINYTKIYNLDEETLFMEFEDKILNG